MKRSIRCAHKLLSLVAFAFLVATTTLAFATPIEARATAVTYARRQLPRPMPPASLAARTAPAPRATPTETRETRLVGKLNLNTADRDELMLLPRVGPTKAERIVRFRTRRGEFKRVKDLRRVKGFGRKTLEKLAPYLAVEGETTLRLE